MKELWFGIFLHGGSYIGYRLEPITIEPLKTKGLAITGEHVSAGDAFTALLKEVHKIGYGYHVHILTLPFIKDALL